MRPSDRRWASCILWRSNALSTSRGDSRQPKYNRGPFDIATLAIFPEYIEFDGEEVLRLVVPEAAGRTIK